MNDAPNRFARELADAISAAVAQSGDVERCRDRVRAAGYQLRLSLEATVGFWALDSEEATEGQPAELPDVDAPPPFEITADDRRFLRSLRIATDEAPVEEPS